jgi:salicylate synthetase
MNHSNVNWHVEEISYVVPKDGSFALLENIISCVFSTEKFFLYNDKRKNEIRLAGKSVEELVLERPTENGSYEIAVESTLPDRTRSYPLEEDPLKQIGAILKANPLPEANAYGYVTFDIVKFYHPYQKEGPIPLAHFIVPSLEIVIAHNTIKIKALDKSQIETVKAVITDLRPVVPFVKSDPNALSKFVESDHEIYSSSVRSLVNDIKGGKLEKAILSRTRWALDTKLDVLATYRSAFNDPAARDFCFSFGRSVACVGISPEPMVIVGNGTVLVTPLAGTRGRSADPVEDARLTEELHTDRKEQYEHLISVMEVNKEMRATCLPDTVSVSPIAEVQYYRTVQHLASTLRGQIKPGCDAWDCLREHAPAVTVSGVGKGAAIAAIDRYESEPRGIYSGSVGWVSCDGQSADFAIAIRGVFQNEIGVKLQAGAGIVAQSTDKYELKETIKKMAMIAPHVHLC